jgi:hypothetical protein
MVITIWPSLACLSLIAYLLLSAPLSLNDSPERFALMVGTRRIWGETDASLRRRCASLARWPFTAEKPQLYWWGRLWDRARNSVRRG